MIRFPLVILAFLSALPALAQAPNRAALQMLFVIDGLRPDSINATDTPNLFRLRSEGVNFENSHAVFPTVTRVNSSSISTGMQPGRHGILGNQIYIPSVDADKAFPNDNYQPLLRMDAVSPGNIVLAPSIAEMAAESGHRYAAVSSGSTGSALLMAPRAPRGSGIVINGDFQVDGQPGWPAAIAAEVARRFGRPAKKGGAEDHYDAQVDWAFRVLREYVLPELKPDVVYNWVTEPDHIQHAFGAGAPQSVNSIRNADRNIGLVLETLAKLGIADRTNLMVVSDHGFGQTVYGVNVRQEFAGGGFKPEDAVIASSGQAVAVHVRDRNPALIRSYVEYLQKQAWIGVVFTAGGSSGREHEGAVPGTFALEYAHLGGGERAPDILFTFPWSSARNRHGVQGTDYVMLSGGETGPMDTATAQHGSMSPWTVRNTMLAWGPGFKRGARVRTPSSNVDVTPTMLHLLGNPKAASLEGRVLSEALAGGPDEEQVAAEVRTLRVGTGNYRAAMQVTETAGRRYLDKSWRE